MKRLFSLVLILSLLLCGCGGNTKATEPSTLPTETTQAPTEATTEPVPTTQPTEPPTEPATEPVVYTNPLTGETLDAPYDGRVFAVTINNIPAALPHKGVYAADLYFEMFVNDYCTRGLALYADISEAASVGSVRSMRYNFTDICLAYDAVAVYAGGSDEVLKDARSNGIDGISVESEAASYYYRDSARSNSGYAWEHTLFVKGPELKEYAESKNIAVTGGADKDYGLSFTENGAPADGEDAATVTIDMKHGSVTKTTTMVYDASSGKYIYNEYGYSLADGETGAPEGFENVIVILCNVQNKGVYHVADLLGSGDGYFACDGKLIPIQWHHESDEDPFTFTYTDGTPLQLGVGSSYIALAPLASGISWE